MASLKSCPSAFSVSSNFSIYPLSETIPVDMLTSNHNKNMLCSVRNKLSHLEEIKPYAKLLEQCVTDDQVFPSDRCFKSVTTDFNVEFSVSL